ncbi:MAG: diaminopimelate decarboxylase [Bacteroidales bacterium]|nr:diaminopimelate decarboxylase [Bacteroidales bacterium]
MQTISTILTRNRILGMRTPFYYYDLNLLAQTLAELKTQSSRYGFRVHYALKANVNPRILEMIKEFGLGADCVSGNEVKLAIETGFEPSDVVYAGVGKTDEEINLALDNDILCFNCESIAELEVINELAVIKNKIARIALRLNPNVDANTHTYISTGLKENKFGIDLRHLNPAIDFVKQSQNMELMGLHFHIGSQITNLEVFKNLCLKINIIQQDLLKKGITPPIINVGGGLGIDYNAPDQHPIADFEGYFEIFAKHLKIMPGQEVHFELGRSVVAQCGSIATRVLYIKEGIEKDFIIIDAGMNDLIRPALYQAEHAIDSIKTKGIKKEYDVVGPVCESSDSFAKAIRLPICKRGDMLLIRSTGAYGEVMSSNYNLRTKAKAYYSKDFEYEQLSSVS